MTGDKCLRDGEAKRVKREVRKILKVQRVGTVFKLLKQCN